MNGISTRRRMLLGAAKYNATPTEAYTIYDYIVQDGSTYFATDIKIARDVLILGVCKTEGKSLVLWSADVLNANGDAFFNLANVKYSSGSKYQQLQCNGPVSVSALPGYAYKQATWTNIAVACQGMQATYKELMRYKNIKSDSDAIADYEPSALTYATSGKNYSVPVDAGPANLYVLGSPLLNGSVNTAGWANSGTADSQGSRLYYIKVYEGGIVTHYLKPATKNDVIGLVDTMTDLFYEPNAGAPSVGNI